MNANVLAPKAEEEFQFNYSEAQAVGMVIFCDSTDGRRFGTTIKISNDGKFIKTVVEIGVS